MRCRSTQAAIKGQADRARTAAGNIPATKPAPKFAEQDWLGEYSIKLQVTCLCSLRGPDVDSTDEIKAWVHFIRRSVSNIIKGKGDFAAADPMVRLKTIAEETHQIDMLKVHFLDHFEHCLEVIGYCHPNEETRAKAIQGYQDICKYFNLTPEAKDVMLARLQDKAAPGTESDHG